METKDAALNTSILGLLSNINHKLVKKKGTGYYDFDKNGGIIQVGTSNNGHTLEPGRVYLVQANEKHSLKIVEKIGGSTIVALDNGGISGFTALLIIVPKTPTFTPKTTGHTTEEYCWKVYCIGIDGAEQYDSKIFEIVETSGNTDKTLDTKLRQVAITTTNDTQFDVWSL